MAAFNYRDLVRLIPPRSWQFYFKARVIELPEGASWEQPVEELPAPILAALESLTDGEQIKVYAELRRVKALANPVGILALRNTVPMADAMLEDFEHHVSDAERALWAMINWPARFAVAEAFLNADAKLGKRSWRRIHMPPAQELHCTPADIDPLRQALALAFTPRKGRPRACEIDVLTRHLDGGVQLDIRVEDNLQRNLEFGPNNETLWRDVRPPQSMTVIIYPDSGVMDLLVIGGQNARKKVLGPLGTHVFKHPIEPVVVPQPMFLLNRLRQGVCPDEHSGLDLRDHRIEKVRLSECRVRSSSLPSCDYQIKPPSEKDAPDVMACIRAHHFDTLMSTGFNITSAVVSLYFDPVGDAKKGRTLHIGLKPTGISNLRDMDEADARLAEKLMLALGVMQELPTPAVRAPAMADIAEL
jgi:hypothetical protein